MEIEKLTYFITGNYRFTLLTKQKENAQKTNATQKKAYSSEVYSDTPF